MAIDTFIIVGLLVLYFHFVGFMTDILMGNCITRDMFCVTILHFCLACGCVYLFEML